MFGSDIIKVKIKGFLRNITENNNLFFNEKGICNKNKISFMSDNIKYSIKYSSSEVIMMRDGNNFINTFTFNNKRGKSSYTLKDNNYTIDMDIDVTYLNISDNSIHIKYMIRDTECTYEYKIEMSECL